jgi:hypothetical protein
MTDDDGILDGLLAATGKKRSVVTQNGAMTLREAFPDGFQVDIDGRSLVVVPVNRR